MLFWLAFVCRKARLGHVPRIKALDIASRIRDYTPRGESVDNSTITRFEQGTTWPRTPVDAIVSAYAEELGLEPITLWTEALRRWTSHQGGAKLSPEDEAVVSKPRGANDGAPGSTPRAPARRRSGGASDR